MFDTYYDFGLKVTRPEALQAEYMDLLEDRLGQVGLDLPGGVEPDYDMRMGYDSAAAE